MASPSNINIEEILRKHFEEKGITNDYLNVLMLGPPKFEMPREAKEGFLTSACVYRWHTKAKGKEEEQEGGTRDKIC